MEYRIRSLITFFSDGKHQSNPPLIGNMKSLKWIRSAKRGSIQTGTGDFEFVSYSEQEYPNRWVSSIHISEEIE